MSTGRDHTDKFCLGPPSEPGDLNGSAIRPASPPLALPTKAALTPEESAARVTATRERIFAGYTKGMAKR